MPAAALPFIASALPAVGQAVAGGKGKAQQQQQSQALQQLFGAESGAINNLMQQYFGQNGTLNKQNQLVGQLENFQGLKPQEVAALQSTLGNAGMSTINTLKSQMGGVANPNAVINQALQGNAQNALNLGTQLGAQGASQELGALEGAGGILGQQAGVFGQGLSGLGNMTNQYASLLQGSGGGTNSLFQGLGGLAGAASGLGGKAGKGGSGGGGASTAGLGFTPGALSGGAGNSPTGTTPWLGVGPQQ